MTEQSLVYRAKLHWIVVVGPLLCVAVIAFIAAGSTHPQLAELMKIWMGIAVIWVAASVISYLISQLGVTEDRIFGKVGFLKGKLVEISLSDVKGISITQGAFGRVLGYGSLVIDRRNEPPARIGKIADPQRLRDAVSEKLSEIRAGD
jgi:uncharacterized membrane protein YdbT with pleckstrin-like domain